jgi:hypothetical protein
MEYRNYTIERTYYGKPAYQFQHNEFDGAPESYFSEHEQEPTSDTLSGLASSIEDAKEQIDEMEDELASDTVVDVFVKLGNYFKSKEA